MFLYLVLFIFFFFVYFDLPSLYIFFLMHAFSQVLECFPTLLRRNIAQLYKRDTFLPSNVTHIFIIRNMCVFCIIIFVICGFSLQAGNIREIFCS